MIFRADITKKIGELCIKLMLAVLLAFGGDNSCVFAATETDEAAGPDDDEDAEESEDGGKDEDDGEDDEDGDKDDDEGGKGEDDGKVEKTEDEKAEREKSEEPVSKSEEDKAKKAKKTPEVVSKSDDKKEGENLEKRKEEEKEEIGEDHGSDLAAWARDMQNYLMKLSLANMPNLSLLISGAEKAEKNCTESQKPAVKKVLENVKALAEILEQKPGVYNGSIQTFRRSVKDVVRYLPQLRLYTKAYKDNEPYNKFVNYDWPALLTNLNNLADKNILAEFDDALTINNEQDLANFVINSVQNLKDVEKNDFPKKETIIGVAKSIIQGKMSYLELFKQVTRLAYLYNYVAYRYDLTILRVSHIRDVRDHIVDVFFDQMAEKAAKIKDEILKLKNEYDVDTYQPAPINKLTDLLEKSGFGNFALQASKLFQAVVILDSKIEQIKKIYIRANSQQKK